jgi:hypothetical protein
MPSDLQRIHRIILDAAEVEIISNEMRAVVESLWPGLAHKLPISTASGMALKLLPTGLGPGIDRAPRLDGLHWNGRSAHLRPMTRSDRMATLEEATNIALICAAVLLNRFGRNFLILATKSNMVCLSMFTCIVVHFTEFRDVGTWSVLLRVS